VSVTELQDQPAPDAPAPEIAPVAEPAPDALEVAPDPAPAAPAGWPVDALAPAPAPATVVPEPEPIPVVPEIVPGTVRLVDGHTISVKDRDAIPELDPANEWVILERPTGQKIAVRTSAIIAYE